MVHPATTAQRCVCLVFLVLASASSLSPALVSSPFPVPGALSIRSSPGGSTVLGMQSGSGGGGSCVPGSLGDGTIDTPTNDDGNDGNGNDDNQPGRDPSERNGPTAAPHVVLVLGGSGYTGRRVCRELVRSMGDLRGSGGGDPVSAVVSVSRSGRPNGGSSSISSSSSTKRWEEEVDWIAENLLGGGAGDDGPEPLLEQLRGVLGRVREKGGNPGGSPSSEAFDLTVVGCIGNANPSPEWTGLWGLGFDNERLLKENGGVYEAFCAKTLGPLLGGAGGEPLVRLRRCVLLSLGYEAQKCLEGPLEGFVEGKRLAERGFLEALRDETKGRALASIPPEENMVVLGLPYVVYGGRRFPRLGALYRWLVESAPARAYVGANRALRSLSKTTTEDWLESMVFSSPIDVDAVGEIAAMAARGLVTRPIVNDGQPRKQDFFDTSGQPIEYENVLFLDGTHAIEAAIDHLRVSRGPQRREIRERNGENPSLAKALPRWEGALVGKRPYLFPVPVVAFFASFFWAVVTEQFVQPPA